MPHQRYAVCPQRRRKITTRFTTNSLLGLTEQDNKADIAEYFKTDVEEVSALLNPKVKYIVPKIK